MARMTATGHLVGALILPLTFVGFAFAAAASSEKGSHLVHGTGTIQKAKPWSPGGGPFFEFVFDPPLHNIHTDGATEEPRPEVAHWALCGDEARFKDNVGNKMRISARPTPSYAETLCLHVVDMVPLGVQKAAAKADRLTDHPDDTPR